MTSSIEPLAAERPRERLMAHGAHVLTSAELLAIILRTGTRGCDAITLGHRLIAHFGGLRGLLTADAASKRKTDLSMNPPIRRTTGAPHQTIPVRS